MPEIPLSMLPWEPQSSLYGHLWKLSPVLQRARGRGWEQNDWHQELLGSLSFGTSDDSV